MTARSELVLWGCTVLASLATVAQWRQPLTFGQISTAVVSGATAVGWPDSSNARRAIYAVTAADPFRLDREPAPVPFEPSRRDGPRVTSQSPGPRPVLILRGIVGGPPWEALLEGLPGRNGASVVRLGERVGDLLIRAIRRDSVIVQGNDTTWRLGMVRAWQ